MRLDAQATNARQMRVGFVMQVLAQGGLEELVVRLAMALKKEGHCPAVLALEEGPLRARIEELGIPVHCFAKQPGVDGALWLRMMARMFRQFDVVHTHHMGPLVYAGPAALCTRVPLVHTMHSNEHLVDAGRRHRWMMRVGFGLSDAITVVHEGLRDFVVGHWPALASRVHTIPNGVDTTYFDGGHETLELRASLSIPKDAKVVGCIARLSPEKGHRDLLEAIALMKTVPYVVFVGSGAEEDALREQAVRLGLHERVRWLGTRYDTPELLSLFSVFALASRREGLPLAALEAMSSKCPLVTTDVGGLPALLQESGAGRLVPQGDVAAFAGALDELINDDGQCLALGESGRRWVTAHASLQAMFQMYLALYKTVSARRGR